MTVDLILRPILVDPPRREDEVFDGPIPESDYRFAPGREFPRRLDHAHNVAVLAGTHVIKEI